MQKTEHIYFPCRRRLITSEGTAQLELCTETMGRCLNPCGLHAPATVGRAHNSRHGEKEYGRPCWMDVTEALIARIDFNVSRLPFWQCVSFDETEEILLVMNAQGVTSIYTSCGQPLGQLSLILNSEQQIHSPFWGATKQCYLQI